MQFAYLHDLVVEPVVLLLCGQQLKLLSLRCVSQAVALRLQALHLACT
jgi:hypothetical protein